MKFLTSRAVAKAIQVTDLDEPVIETPVTFTHEFEQKKHALLRSVRRRRQAVSVARGAAMLAMLVLTVSVYVLIDNHSGSSGALRQPEAGQTDGAVRFASWEDANRTTGLDLIGLAAVPEGFQLDVISFYRENDMQMVSSRYTAADGRNLLFNQAHLPDDIASPDDIDHAIFTHFEKPMPAQAYALWKQGNVVFFVFGDGFDTTGLTRISSRVLDDNPSGFIIREIQEGDIRTFRVSPFP